MRKHRNFLTPFLLLAAFVFVMPTTASAYFLDADSLTTGYYSAGSPLNISTPFGSVSFVGEIRDPDGDPEFNTAGASGNVFDIGTGDIAYLTFSFDITSASFIYGGNVGVFDIEARDIGGNVVDSFFQADTNAGFPAGPITLSGSGIRSLYWQDIGYSFSAIDNLNISSVPEPATFFLLGTSFIGLAALRRRFKK